METDKKKSFGVIGLGTMGLNLLENLADKGYACAGYDIDDKKVEQLNELNGSLISGYTSINDFVGSLSTPKTVMMLVPAGDIVDDVIQQLLPLLDKGSIIIDGGNSHFTDTERRNTELESKGYHFIGMGVSGGEEGARKGPSLMPGGDKGAYEIIAPILKDIAAHVGGDPMIAYMGARSAGHFVKMVHNGIEYAIMQLISEVYSILKHRLKFDDSKIHDVFKKWNEGRLESYLLDITRDIFAFTRDGDDSILLNLVRDEAKAKGTGKWTSQVAMDLQLPVPIIDTAVTIRNLSIFKNMRIHASKVYPNSEKVKEIGDSNPFLDDLEKAYYFGMASAYAQGMHLFSVASDKYQYGLRNDIIANIWRGGCIIRSKFLEEIYRAFTENVNLEHLFLDEFIRKNLTECIPSLRKLVSKCALQGIAVPAFSSALSYFDNFRCENMPTNLIQAQRDYFGSHTYEMKGKKGVFHSKWIMKNIEP